MTINVPLAVPKKYYKTYKKNFKKATHNTGNLFLFAGDQKIEHLNEDFAVKSKNNNSDPEHLFQIALKSPIGVFAVHLGLVSRYGKKYKKIPYLIKLNGKSNLVKTSDPLSKALWTVEDVVKFKKDSGLDILGVGYTLYLGSEYEAKMMKEASQIIWQAHQNGLLAVLWIYPRGKNVKNEKSLEILSGSAGVGLCLGADFIKLNYPFGEKEEDAKKFKEVIIAGGNSGIICSGGKKIDSKKLLKIIKNQIKITGARGCAIGRNLHQKDLSSAIKLATEINKNLK
ncbi:MAG: aldolase [Patescibacteria group bacterium]|jgi:fructose-bisphosphate aldolase/6-deoxy-5-ketofructose 1-phosphate synthase